MRALARSILIFGLCGLVGPLIRWATWPPARPTEGVGEDFIYNLVLLLWPAQPLAAIEASTGRLVAAAVSVGANLLLFSALGVAVGLLVRRPAPVVVLYLATCAAVLAFALWIVGFEFAYLSLIALMVAFLIYAVPFFSAFRLAGTAKAQG